MRKFILFFLTVLSCSFHLQSQDFSNKGKEFWIGYGHHVRMMNSTPWPAPNCIQQGNNSVCPEKMELYITSDVSTQGKIEIAGIGFSQSFTINANQITTVEIPRAAGLPDDGTYNSGIHVTAEKPIVVYSFIYVSSISGATLCLPVATLGREYVSINFNQVSNEPNTYSYFFVIATDPGTTKVEIIPTSNTKGGMLANIPDTIELKQGEIRQVLSTIDLTGSTIRSINDGSGCKRIAVYSGSSKISIGCNGTGTSDNLYQQLYPTNTWGKTYLFAPAIQRTNTSGLNNFIRVIKSDPSAVISYNGVVYPSGNQKYVTLPITNQPGIIEADKPIMVAQYFTTQGCSGNNGQGDPDMIFLNPVEQTINKVTLNAMQPTINTNINDHYINVIIKNDPNAYSSFSIDGVNFGNVFQPHPAAPGYAYARISVSRGTHNLYCDTPFNAIAYGFGNTESYGYSAGTNLKDLYQFVSIKNVYGTVSFPAGCKSSPLEFSMTFPYQPISIAWKFNGLFKDTTLFNPRYDSSWIVNGRTIYRYKLNKSYQVDAIGTYPIKLIAFNPTADGCSGEQEIDYDLQIFDQPQASFQTTFTGCVTDSIRFTDLSAASNVRPIILRFWDFGDNTAASTANPITRYKTGGTYNASLRVITDIGCISTSTSKPIVVSNIPIADLAITGPYCEKGEILLDDKTNPMGTPIRKWYFNYGDSTLDSISVTTPYRHVYPKSGQYKLQFYVSNALGCQSNIVSRTITIAPKPLAGFGLPEVCLDDAFALFSDSSGIADNSILTYAWDFGDGSKGTGKDPKHRFTAAGNYEVTQYLTSTSSCKDTLKKSFTVNGAVPTARFEVLGGNLCSNSIVTVRNKSGVDFGKVTRLVIQWDATNPGLQTIDEEPTPDKLYKYQYTSFQQPSSKNITVKLMAYSGIVCLGEITQQITLLGSPAPVLAAIPEVCDNDVSFALAQGSDASGLTVNTKYIGAGITGNNVFNPARAGKGLHEIFFVSTTAAGCSDTTRGQIIVNESPKVNAGPDRTVLEGTFITLEASSTSVGTLYSWSPSEGLDNQALLRPSASTKRDMLYTLKVESAKGCVGTDQVFVRYLPKLVVPNTFTPNGDGYNDKWEINGILSYPGCVVEIYNTAGTMLFRSQGYGQPWDGATNGKQVPAGTYYYVIDPKNGRPRIAGYVTIFR